MSDHIEPSPSHATQLEATLRKEGIPEDVAKRFVEIADRHYKLGQKKLDEQLVCKEVERFISKMMTAQPLNESQQGKLKAYLIDFLIQFSAGGALALVAYYVVIVKQFFMSVETESMRKDKEAAAEMYELHFADLTPSERRFISSNMDSLEKVREGFRRGLTEAVAQSGTIENAGLAAIFFNMSIEENLIIEPLRQRLALQTGV